jgi:hypothetical protein
MRKIKMLVEDIEEEIEDAKEYAERHVEAKALGDAETAKRYKEMAEDELKHAMYLHETAVAEIKEASKIHHPPAEMEAAWRDAHKEYVEKASLIRQMLTL